MFGSQGQRVFNVNVNGAPALTNFDILNDVPSLTADDKQFPVSVTNGTIQIDVIGVVGRGLLSGIQVFPAAGTPTISTFTAAGTTLSWTTANATTVTIDQGIGAVAASGSTTVTPAATTTYTLTASNATASVTRTVTVPSRRSDHHHLHRRRNHPLLDHRKRHHRDHRPGHRRRRRLRLDHRHPRIVPPPTR